MALFRLGVNSTSLKKPKCSLEGMAMRSPSCVSSANIDDGSRPFDEDRLALMMLLNLVNHTSHIFLRTYHLGVPWFSFHGTHELVIGREESCLQLKRWSVSERAPKIWASLSFKTWEGMPHPDCLKSIYGVTDPSQS